MKTAMQEAIEIIEGRLKALKIAQRTESVNGAIGGYQYSKYLLTELLEKEKEQIIDAYENGYEACDMDEAMEVNKKLTSGDLYYNMNYNQNK